MSFGLGKNQVFIQRGMRRKNKFMVCKVAKYQSFKSKWTAEEAYEKGPDTFQNLREKILPKQVLNSISVDTACSGNPGKVEYRGVYTDTQTELFHKKIDGLGTNNLGNFAIVHALAWQGKEGCELPIYSDSETAISWIKKKAVKTTLKESKETMKFLI